MEWQYYRQAWEAERALKAAVPTAWLMRGSAAFAVVRFPRGAKRLWSSLRWSFWRG